MIKGKQDQAGCFQGTVASVKFYDRALSARGIRTAYKTARKQCHLLWYQRLYDWFARFVAKQ